LNEEVLVDTDVVSYLLNRHTLAQTYEELPHAVDFFHDRRRDVPGALKRNWGQHRIDELDTHLRQFAVVPYNVQVCLSYARVCAAAEKRGRPIDTADAFIAATAFWLGVTNNDRHFQGIDGLTVISAR
jgi:hypothetical protein